MIMYCGRQMSRAVIVILTVLNCGWFVTAAGSYELISCAELRVTERHGCGQLRVRMEWEIEWLAVQYCGWHTTSWLQAATKYDTGIWIDLNVLSNEVGWFVLIFRLFYWEMAIYVFCLCVDSLWLWTYMAMDSMLRLLWTNLAEVFAWSSPWMLHSWLLFFPGRLWSGFFNEDHADTLYFQLLSLSSSDV